jgi:hypothetical protein
MKILSRHREFVHTHFVTDGVRLPSHRMREIQDQLRPFLRRLGIVFGIHFASHAGEEGIRVVLECIPVRDVLDFIQVELQRVIAPIPARPRPTRLVRLDRPPGDPGQTAERERPANEATM